METTDTVQDRGETSKYQNTENASASESKIRKRGSLILIDYLFYT